MKCTILLGCLSLLFANSIRAQNLLTNGGFEDKNICVEYHVTCAPEAWFKIPGANVYAYTFLGMQAHSGEFFQNIVVENLKKPVLYRSFIYTKILCPLLHDSLYEMSMWVNSLNNNFSHLSIWLSNDEPIKLKTNLTDINTQVTFTPGNIVTGKVEGWLKISYRYKATGDERFLMIGNFSKDALQGAAKTNAAEDVIYQLDDVELRPFTSSAPCDEYQATRQQLYDMNYRHSPKKFIDDIPLKQMLVTKQSFPKDRIDTLRKKEIRWVIVDTPPSLKTIPVINDTLILPDILFRFNSSAINPAFANLLDSALQQIKKSTYKRIEIVGHTDNAGTNAYNERLSLNRAASVMEYFVKRKFEAGLIKFLGKGEEQPIAQNTTAEGRQKNRRVEIILVR